MTGTSLRLASALRLAGFLVAALVLAGPLLAAPTPVAPVASAEGALRHVTALSRQIGPRPSGAPGYLRAVEYVEGQLRTLGYHVERQPFSFLYFESRGATLRPAGSAEAIPAVVPEYSAATPPPGLEAALVEAGVGRPEELQRAGVSGRIVLVERGPQGFLFRDKVEYAAAAGAVGIVIYNHVPDPVQQVTLLAPARIPAIVISQEAGRRLIAQLRQGAVRVLLRVDTLTEQRTTWNVIGRRTGRSPRTLVIGAHLDSVEVSPGANDNGSGMAAVIETARLLANASLEFSVEIVGFGAEERGLLGSAHYVRERGDRVAGMVNLDMVGRGALSAGSGSGGGPLVEAAERAADRLGLRITRFRLPGGSDHASFERAGIPAVFLHTGDDPLIHTPNDVLERLDPQLIAQAAQLAAALALEPGTTLR